MRRSRNATEAVPLGGRLFLLLAITLSAADFRTLTLPHKLEYSPTLEKHLIETMTGGVAAFDYNNDGFIDLFFVNGAEQPSLRKTSPKYWNRLYRNDGVAKGTFTDVTESSGLQGEGFSMGTAAADFDNDGLIDLFVAGVNGASRLYRNKGKGVFSETSLPAIPGWAVGGGWFDYDRDGYLDLFIVKYVAWDPAREPVCGSPVRTYCHPREYDGTPNQILRNNRDGTFTDVSAASGIAKYGVRVRRRRVEERASVPRAAAAPARATRPRSRAGRRGRARPRAGRPSPSRRRRPAGAPASVVPRRPRRARCAAAARRAPATRARSSWCRPRP